MLWVCSDVFRYTEFKERFAKRNDQMIDLGRVPSDKLADECDAITAHHLTTSVFLGYLEPGWMLSSTDQTRLRKLLRKFDVGMVSQYSDSIPHSWKTEIDTYYTR